MHDVGEAHHIHFIVMEYVQEGTLQDLVRSKGSLPFAEACKIICEACKGLIPAHDQGMVHRDVTPGNIFCPPRGAAVGDFGLVRAALDSTITGDEQILGTWNYMPLEQFRSAEVTPAADVYGLGATLYYLLCGEHAFPPAADIQSRLDAPCFPRLQDRRPDAPPELAALVAKATANEPNDRPKDAKALEGELMAIELRLRTHEQPQSTSPSLVKRLRNLHGHTAVAITRVFVSLHLARTLRGILLTSRSLSRCSGAFRPRKSESSSSR